MYKWQTKNKTLTKRTDYKPISQLKKQIIKTDKPKLMKKQTTITLLILIWALSISFAQAQITSYPYTESFEGDPASFTWDNLVADANGSCGLWEYGATTETLSTGPSSAQDGSIFINIDADNCNGQISYTSSPTFDLTGLQLPTFSYYYHRLGSNMGDLDVEISTDGGSNWLTLITHTGEESVWTAEVIDLSAYIDQDVIIRFGGFDGGGSLGDMAIDNIQLYDAGIINGAGDVVYFYDEAGNRTRREYTIMAMAQAEQELIAAARSVEEGSELEFLSDELFKVYPNPATDFIQVESLEATGPTTVHLLDAAGRELHVAYINDASSVQIDMSTYRSGIYVMWIQMEDRVVTKKIIKH